MGFIAKQNLEIVEKVKHPGWTLNKVDVNIDFFHNFSSPGGQIVGQSALLLYL